MTKWEWRYLILAGWAALAPPAYHHLTVLVPDHEATRVYENNGGVVHDTKWKRVWRWERE